MEGWEGLGVHGHLVGVDLGPGMVVTGDQREVREKELGRFTLSGAGLRSILRCRRACLGSFPASNVLGCPVLQSPSSLGPRIWRYGHGRGSCFSVTAATASDVLHLSESFASVRSVSAVFVRVSPVQLWLTFTDASLSTNMSARFPNTAGRPASPTVVLDRFDQ